MRAMRIVAVPCLLGLIGLAVPGQPPQEQLLTRAQEKFRLGVEKLRQPTESRRLFAQAAKDFEYLHVRSPAYYLSLGNAEALAGRWPNAIWAYHCGLRIDPNSAALREHLAYARSLVNYSPGGRGRPTPDAWPSWLHRPTTVDMVIVAATACSLAWLVGGWWYACRRPLALRVALGLFAIALASAAGCFLDERQTSEAWRHPLLIVATDTPFYRGNGASYPLHPDVPTLAAGLEARHLHQRGSWLLVQLTTGEIGWVSIGRVLIVPPDGISLGLAWDACAKQR